MLTVTRKMMLGACCDTGACRQTNCLKTSGQTVRLQRHITAAFSAAPRVARWWRRAFPGCMDGTPRPTAAAAGTSWRLRRHALPGWQRCHASPNTPRRAAATRGHSPASGEVAQQRMSRPAAGSLVPSVLIAAAVIQHTHLYARIRDKY